MATPVGIKIDHREIVCVHNCLKVLTRYWQRDLRMVICHILMVPTKPVPPKTFSSWLIWPPVPPHLKVIMFELVTGWSPVRIQLCQFFSSETAIAKFKLQQLFLIVCSALVHTWTWLIGKPRKLDAYWPKKNVSVLKLNWMVNKWQMDTNGLNWPAIFYSGSLD